MNAFAGIPTIRLFEALACGIPMVSAPWQDAEGLFRVGEDLLFAKNGKEMTSRLDAVLSEFNLARGLAQKGLQTIRDHHTCAHRVDELFNIVDSLDLDEG